MTVRMPNFLHLGPGKAGSTWLHETLTLHPEVCLTEAKDLYFFSRYYERGPEWYRSQFSAAGPEHRVVGEVCPDYLAAPRVAERIEETLGSQVRLMVTLRDPAERAFSSYLYAQKFGLAAPTFRETIEQSPEMVTEGRYGTQLESFAGAVDDGRMLVSVFDDLQRDPQGFLDATTDWLHVSRLPLTPEQLGAKLPASRARFQPLARAAQRGAQWARAHNQARMVGLVKRSPLIGNVLYRPLGADRPELDAEDAALVKELLGDEVQRAEELSGLPLRRIWNW